MLTVLPIQSKDEQRALCQACGIEFIENALNSDAKTAARAQLCIDSHFYGL